MAPRRRHHALLPHHAPPSLRSLMAECWAEGEHARPPSADLVRRLRLLYFNEFGAEFEFGTRGQGPALAQHFTAQHFAAFQAKMQSVSNA